MKPATPITCATFAQDVLEGRANVSQPHDHKHQQPLLFGPASLVGGGSLLTNDRERIAAQVFQPGHRYHHFVKFSCHFYTSKKKNVLISKGLFDSC